MWLTSLGYFFYLFIVNVRWNKGLGIFNNFFQQSLTNKMKHPQKIIETIVRSLQSSAYTFRVVDKLFLFIFNFYLIIVSCCCVIFIYVNLLNLQLCCKTITNIIMKRKIVIEQVVFLLLNLFYLSPTFIKSIWYQLL